MHKKTAANTAVFLWALDSVFAHLMGNNQRRTPRLGKAPSRVKPRQAIGAANKPC